MGMVLLRCELEYGSAKMWITEQCGSVHCGQKNFHTHLRLSHAIFGQSVPKKTILSTKKKKEKKKKSLSTITTPP